VKDLHLLPKVRDSWSYLYVEHCKIDQEAKAIAIHDAEGKTPVPCASLTLLMLGPGTSISHAAIRALAENGCMVLWTGEKGVRMYAQGMGETRSSQNFLRQAHLHADPVQRLAVVMRMYRMRFAEQLDNSFTLQQIRGREGVRVREAYARASRETSVEWSGRSYQRDDWNNADPINRALSAANSCLYGVCHAAIVSAGYSPALGFVHTGKMLSFVYDVADLYKMNTTVPAAFREVAAGVDDLESRVRRACRDMFHEERLLPRIVSDMDTMLQAESLAGDPAGLDFDNPDDAPGGLWDPQVGHVEGGINQAEQEPKEGEPWS